ncbi:MAG: hypothetical protein Q4A74_09980, partial [Cardiobacteriaceae bacterium]|nr:hypothetical protein [Cardiobacteriaceae bacterium]
HKLIKEGAKLVENLEDILQECPRLLQKNGMSSYSIKNDGLISTSKVSHEMLSQPKEQAVNISQLKGEEEAGTEVLLHQMGYDPVHPDSLADRLDLATADVYALLLEMELAGLVSAMPGGRYQRIRKES